MLLQFLRARYEVSVLLPEEGPLCQRLAAEGLAFHVMPGLTWPCIPRIHRLIKSQGIDLVYGNNPSNRSRNALVAAKLAGRPFVWHFRGMKQHWGWRKGLFVKWADEVVAVSAACAHPLEKYRRDRGVNVIHNGVDVAKIDERSRAGGAKIDEELGLKPDTRYAISLSHVIPRKGLDHALRVMRKIADHRGDVELLIAGSLDRDRRFVKELRQRVGEMGLANRVHLLGYRTDVPQLLARCDVLLHTAERDPHPRAVLEAMATSTPVVAFGIDGVRETIVDGESGRLLPFGDEEGMAAAVMEVLDSDRLAATMRANARKSVERSFSAEATAAKVANLIDRLVAPRASADVADAIGDLSSS